jgi:opacity protein-like surface antigen
MPNCGCARLGIVALAGWIAASGIASAEPNVDALERRLLEMEREMRTLRAELKAMRDAEPAQDRNQQALDARVAGVESALKPMETRVAQVESAALIKGNRVFFRGGWANLVEDRANGAFTDMINVPGALAGVGLPLAGIQNDSDDGWYFGAGFDFLLSRDTLGLLPGVWTLAELSVEYRDLGGSEAHLIGPVAECLLLNEVLAGGVPGAANCTNIRGRQNLMMLTVSASPKLKFMEGSKLRPWIIPAGFDVNVISPPSDSTNYIDVGVQFGAGLDYEIMPGITLGADVRYHWAADMTDPDYEAPAISAAAAAAAGFPPGLALDTDQDNDSWTAGISLGIGF